MIIIDPPFITKEVWRKYAITARLLGKQRFYLDADTTDRFNTTLVLATTVMENNEIMNEFFGAKPVKYRPNIPHLVYQYDVFCNFPSHELSRENPEFLSDNIP